MTRLGPIIALLACAGLGYLAGHNRTTAERCSSSGSEPPAAVNRIVPASAPVETPLVEKLLPKVPKGLEEDIGDKKFFIDRNVNVHIDGTVTKNGKFKYEFARNIYVPVDLGNRRYLEDGHAPTAKHLIEDHGHAASSALLWTQDEREIAHANDHAVLGAVRPAAAPAQSSCPNGQCGNPSYGRGLFGRRR